MRISAHALWLPKSGNSKDEYEDAVWPRKKTDSNLTIFRAAVADGATETSFAGLWARILVREYGLGDLTDINFNDRLSVIRQRWLKRVSNLNLPWYAQQKLEMGAYSSLVGLTIVQDLDRSRIWNAMAIGDSCLFQLRGDQILEKFPLSHSEQFNSRPALLATGNQNGDTESQFVRSEGTWEFGDKFYLMSDALACWFLRLWELRDGNPLEFEQEFLSRESFELFIETQRKISDDSVTLKNDDVTLLRCIISEF